MIIWLVCPGEPLPIDLGCQRLMRAGLLCATLRQRGHDVVWWTSDFDHSAKRHRHGQYQTITTADGAELKLLSGVSYTRNVSVARLVNHFQVGREFSRRSTIEPRPNVIYCCWPTVELGFNSVRYALSRNIPVVLDVRDLWPDILSDAVPHRFRWLGNIVLKPYFQMTRRAFQQCTGIIGISKRYLDWGLTYAGRPQGRYDRVFPLGYQEPVFPADALGDGWQILKDRGVDGSRTICWFIGSFGATYDLECVIEAARTIANSGNKKVQFVLSGDGEYRKKWERMARGLDNVVFTGWLNASQIAAMMRMARIGLASYQKGAPQGLPNKVFEYLAGGLPILSCLTGECQELLESAQCGQPYRAGDSNSLAEAILQMAGYEVRLATMAANARKLFQTHYAASIIYPALADFLETLGQSCSVTALQP